MEVDSIPQQTQDKIGSVEKADLVVGILVDLEPDGVAILCNGLSALPGSPRIVVFQGDSAPTANAEKPPATQENSSVSLLSWSAIGSSPSAPFMQSVPAACEAIFATGEKLGAKACCVVASKMESRTPRWVCDLLQPLLEAEFDLVVPYYAPSKLQGLLNSSIVYPLTRSLYGKKIHNPLGPDVGVSRRLAQRILDGNRNAKAVTNRMHPLASLSPIAVCANLQICQVHVGERVYPPTNWMNVSSLMSQVLSPVFLEMDRTAACWQRARGSVAIPTHGAYSSSSEEKASPLDLNRMMETFQLGLRDLQEIWNLVLPPATLFELRKLSRLPPEQASMPDDLWARIVYDFALAHRLRTVNPDHLLRSMTPLYMAWVSSYVRGMERDAATTVEQRIERLSLAYEAAKPYLVSRWRWPDRFNP